MEEKIPRPHRQQATNRISKLIHHTSITFLTAGVILWKLNCTKKFLIFKIWKFSHKTVFLTFLKSGNTSLFSSWQQISGVETWLLTPLEAGPAVPHRQVNFHQLPKRSQECRKNNRTYLYQKLNHFFSVPACHQGHRHKSTNKICKQPGHTHSL